MTCPRTVLSFSSMSRALIAAQSFSYAKLTVAGTTALPSIRHLLTRSLRFSGVRGKTRGLFSEDHLSYLLELTGSTGGLRQARQKKRLRRCGAPTSLAEKFPQATLNPLSAKAVNTAFNPLDVTQGEFSNMTYWMQGSLSTKSINVQTSLDLLPSSPLYLSFKIEKSWHGEPAVIILGLNLLTASTGRDSTSSNIGAVSMRPSRIFLSKTALESGWISQ